MDRSVKCAISPGFFTGKVIFHQPHVALHFAAPYGRTAIDAETIAAAFAPLFRHDAGTDFRQIKDRGQQRIGTFIGAEIFKTPAQKSFVGRRITEHPRSFALNEEGLRSQFSKNLAGSRMHQVTGIIAQTTLMSPNRKCPKVQIEADHIKAQRKSPPFRRRQGSPSVALSCRATHNAVRRECWQPNSGSRSVRSRERCRLRVH